MRVIAAVTGTRAEYGLLRPVMSAIAARAQLDLRVIVAGTHLLPPQPTVDEVAAAFSIAAKVPMQSAGQVGRAADALALGRGVLGFAELWSKIKPDTILVLGDRIEPFAAASAAAVAGIRIAHMHGGDRAEGIADESLRHAISKLAHIHLPATATSAQRLIAMGEEPKRVHVVGSPAIDGLANIPPMRDRDFEELGAPEIIVLLHPVGDDESIEEKRAAGLLSCAQKIAPTLALHPNHDPGREGIVRAIEQSGCRSIHHLPREKFIGLLRRVKVLVGNSSAGLIECAALPLACVSIGARQAGREMPANVTNVPVWDYQTIEQAIRDSLSAPLTHVDHPYGNGRTGERVADLLANLDFQAHGLVKRNTY